jgi:bromodomain-containing protein 7
LLRETGLDLLHRKRPSDSPDKEDTKKRLRSEKVSNQVNLSLHTYPQAEPVLSLIKQIYTHQIDMAALLKRPEEFVETESVFSGKKEVDEGAGGVTVKTEMSTDEKQVEFGKLLQRTAELIEQISKSSANSVKEEEVDGVDGESEKMKNLRLHLLALAKWVPVDKIARLPKDLVPESVRHLVPIIDS